MNHQMECLIVDDEPIARKVLREYIEDIEFLELIGEAENPVQADGIMARREIDLLLLDIQMPKITGIGFLKNLRPAPPVIITTAYPEYALDGYELDVLDYLLKPIGFERFLKAAKRALEYHELKTCPTRGTSEDFFFIKCGQRLEKIKVAEILYIEAMENYVAIHTSSRKYLTYLTTKGIAEKLDQNQFIRSHKSYIVSVGAIQSIEGDAINIGQVRIPISKHFRNEVLRRIDSALIRR